MIRVLLLEPQTLLREGLAALLRSASELELVGAAAEAASLLQELRPDVVVMRTPDAGVGDGEIQRRIADSNSPCRILVVLTDVSRQALFACLQAGATGVVHNNAPFAELVSAIRLVCRGGTYLSPVLANLVVSDYSRKDQHALSDADCLSKREKDVLTLIAEGHNTSDIAGLLGISVRTVEVHRRRTMTKLDIHSIAGLTRFALRQGLTSI